MQDQQQSGTIINNGTINAKNVAAKVEGNLIVNEN